MSRGTEATAQSAGEEGSFRRKAGYTTRTEEGGPANFSEPLCMQMRDFPPPPQFCTKSSSPECPGELAIMKMSRKVRLTSRERCFMRRSAGPQC